MAFDPQEQLAKWHKAVHHKDYALLKELLADDIALSSPVFWRAKEGKGAVLTVLSTVINVFEDFQYHREWIDGSSWALEFSATVNGKDLKGIDLIELNDEGKLKRLEVLIRPLNALQTFGLEMDSRLRALQAQNG